MFQTNNTEISYTNHSQKIKTCAHQTNTTKENGFIKASAWNHKMWKASTNLLDIIAIGIFLIDATDDKSQPASSIEVDPCKLLLYPPTNNHADPYHHNTV